MRYRLGSLLFAAGIGPPALAVAWWIAAQGPPDPIKAFTCCCAGTPIFGIIIGVFILDRVWRRPGP